MKIVVFLAISAFFLACGTKKNTSSDTIKKEAAINKTDLETMKMKATIGKFAKESDPIMSIDAIEVNENTLYIDITYGGGCKDHEFEIIGSEAIAKSLPPIRAVQIVHHANEDNCRSIVKKRLEVDITDLAYLKEKDSEIYLTFENWEGRVLYKYKK
ncbi:MAG: hypothetical protein M9916_10535 [Crocinitomicaceae bacterium]|nr:hypothetical protein [Crocinitomicaceae bacterium]